MSKRISVFCLALVVGITLFGCAKVAEQGGGGGIDVTNVTGSPPPGTTQVKLACGNVSVSGNNLGFSITALDQNNNVLTGMGGGNYSGAVYNQDPSIQSVTATTTLTAVTSLAVTAVTFGGANVSSALVIDKSGSMLTAKLVTAEIAAKMYVDKLAAASSNNKAAIVLFSDYASVEAPMMNIAANKTTLYNAIDKRTGYLGVTSLYYGIAIGIWEASREAPSANRVRAVVAMTDGVENNSPPPYGGIAAGTIEVVNQAKKASVPIYTIGLFATTSEANSYRQYLINIARETTGSADNYFEVIVGVTGLSVSAKTIRALGILTDLYNKIAGALSQSYSFTTATSSGGLTPGAYWLLVTLKNYGSFTGQELIVPFIVQ